MSHDIESPQPPVGGPRGERDSVAGAKSEGAPTLARPSTVIGLGFTPVIPAPPLTEVVPTPEHLRDPASALSRALAAGPDDAPLPEPVEVVRPRPSETVMGATAPLHTAEDANTQVDISTLSAGDADRILAAADAAKSARPAAQLPSVSRTSSLPPPPGLRRGGLPPLGGGLDASASGVASQRKPAIAQPGPPPAATPTAGPPPPVKLATTLLFGKQPPAPITPPPSDSAVPARRSARPPPPSTPPPRRSVPPPAPPPPAPAPARPAPRESSEEISASFFLDETGERGPLPPQPISSTSLVEDPPSSPDLELDEAALLAAPPPPPPPPPAPPVSSRPASSGVAVDLAGRTFSAVASPDAVLETADATPPVDAGPKEDLELVTLAEPIGPVDDADHGRDRPTQPMATRRLPSEPEWAPPARPAWFGPAAIIGGAVFLAIGVGVVAYIVKSVHSAVVSPAPSALPTASDRPEVAVAPSASTKPSVTEPPRAPSAAAACVLAGAPHTIAPRALLKTGIEGVATTDRIGLGVALADRDGFVVALDPSTFVALGSSRSKSDAPLRRVFPVLGASPADVSATFETAKKRPGLEAAHQVASGGAAPPFVVGIEDGALVWAASTTAAPTTLWPLAGDGPVEAIRTLLLPRNPKQPQEEGFAVAFRQGSSIYVGALHADKTANGDLLRIGGLGPQIGAPTIAASSDHVLVAWADRPSASVPWSIRWLAWRPGGELPSPEPFPAPPGGSGGAVMSPSLTSLSDGRLVIAWTEGAGRMYQVRVQALDSTEHLLGSPLTVSAERTNAGQGVPVLTPDGRGAVVFLSAPQGANAAVVAVPIVCTGAP